MKKIIMSLLLASTCLVACQPQAKSPETKLSANQIERAKQGTYLISNLADDVSFNDVKTSLRQHLSSDSVNQVMAWITDYNDTIQKTSLNKGFEETQQPNYDVAKIDELWRAAKGDFVGTNCRINTYALLKDKITISEGEADDSQLFIDQDAISQGKLFDDAQLAQFNQLFSRVETEDTKDAKIHAGKMVEHFKQVTFDETATMLSVVMHNQLDGDHLFIGHVGVLVPSKDGYLFLEKISFQEPYQAVKFKTKDQAYDYLLEKYTIDYNQPTAQPFIMENDQLVAYNE